MTAKRNKEINSKKTTLEHLAKAALASQSITTQNLRNSHSNHTPTVTFTTEFNDSKSRDIELVRPSRVDSIVGMEKNETTHERLIE